MKSCLTTGLILLGFLAPSAIASAVEGRGIWCPNDVTIEESFGFWFKNDKAHNWRISILNVRSWTYDYFEETRQININLGEYILNRATLEMTRKGNSGEVVWQCFLVSSEQDLAQQLKDITDKIKTENKF